MSSPTMTAAIAAAASSLDAYNLSVAAENKVSFYADSSGQFLYVHGIGPDGAPPISLGGLNLWRRGDRATAWIYTDPASGIQPYVG